MPDAASEDASLQVGSRVWLASADFAEQPYYEATVTSIAAASSDGGHGAITVMPANALGYSSQPKQVRRDEVHLANVDRDGYGPDDHCGLVHLNEPTLLHSTVVRSTLQRHLHVGRRVASCSR